MGCAGFQEFPFRKRLLLVRTPPSGKSEIFVCAEIKAPYADAGNGRTLRGHLLGHLLNQPWLATKILTPHRSYIFHERKPQVDHIFPLKLAGTDETYRRAVDVVWNFQPMPAEVNGYKRAKHPKTFFSSEDGNKYWSSYDFIPECTLELWNDYRAFIDDRERRMRVELKRLYDIELDASP